MRSIAESRVAINEIDKQMADLFCRRMEIVKDVALYKKERCIGILDAEREALAIVKNSAYVDDAVLKGYYIGFHKNIMEVSKQYQHRILSGMRIACSGVGGAFAHIAARKIFPDGQHLFFDNFAEAYKSVEDGICDSCVLPLENSYAGEVAKVTDLIFSGSLWINGVYDLQVRHSLLGLPDAEIGDIKSVFSHPQAFGQCEDYIKAHNFRQINQTNTAVAAQLVAQGKDKSVAAIASKETAELYGLKVLDHDINDSGANTTRFATFARVENRVSRDDSTFILVFSVRNVVGALARAISLIGKYGFNMRVLRSRPIKDQPWQYFFYMEAEGNIYGEKGQAMLNEFGEQCNRVKIAGSFLKEGHLS